MNVKRILHFLVFAILLLVSCGKTSKPKADNAGISQSLKVLELETPIHMEGFGNVNDIAINADTLCFNINIQDGMPMPLINKINTKKNLAGEIVSEQIKSQNKNVKDALARIADMSIPLKVTLQGSEEGGKAIIVLTYKQMKDAANDETNMSNTDFSLEMVAMTTRLLLPAQVDELTHWTDTKLTKDAFEYVYKIDDSQIDMTNLDTKLLKDEKSKDLRNNYDLLANVIKNIGVR